MQTRGARSPLVDSAEPRRCISEEPVKHLPPSPAWGPLRPGAVAVPPRSHSKQSLCIHSTFVEGALCGSLGRANTVDGSKEEEGKGQSCQLPWREAPSFLGDLPSVAWPYATSGGMATSISPQAFLGVTSCLE